MDKKGAFTFIKLGAAVVPCSFFIYLLSGSICLVNFFTGLPCPGCGSSRAFFFLLAGDYKSSLHYHPLLFLSLFLIIFAAGTFIFKFKIAVNEKLLWVLIGIYVIIYIARMIMYFPETEPMTINNRAVVPRILSLVKKR